MNIRLLVAVGVFAAFFASGLVLTRIFLKTTPPNAEANNERPTVVSVDQPRIGATPAITVTSSNPPTEKLSESTAAATVSTPIETPRRPEYRPWWRGLAGRRCHVVLGTSSSLRIRKGKLVGGTIVHWQEMFADQPQVGTLFNERDNVVLVHGVGINAKGLPVAAQITHTADGSEINGIIALSVKELRVTLYPVDDENQTP